MVKKGKIEREMIKREMIKREMIEKKDNSFSAYLTVEAALVMPIVLGVILLTIYLMFFQFNRCLMDQNTGILAVRACTSQIINRKERMAELLLMSQMEDDRYLAWDMGEVEIKFIGSSVYVKREGMLKCPFPGLVTWAGGNEWSSIAKYKNNRINPVSVIRIYRNAVGGR